MTRAPLAVGLSLSPTWMRGDAWRRPDSRAEDLFESDLYVDVARAAEGAGVDFVFKPDVLMVDPGALEHSFGMATLDPVVMLATLARETSRVGLVSTASSTFAPPYLVAREIQSLDRVSRGRAGLNVVTSLGGQQNFGLDQMPPSDERQAAAHRWLDTVRRLWASFPADALVVDREAGRYADPARLATLDGPVRGPLGTPAVARGRIPILQAGGSPAGRDFAAQHADAVFAAAPTLASALEQRGDLRRRAVGHGRAAGDVRVLPGLSLHLAPTRAEAERLHEASVSAAETGRTLAGLSRLLGTDLADLPRDRPIPGDVLPAGAREDDGPVGALAALIARGVTPAALVRTPEAAPSLHWTVVGTPDDAVAQVRDRVAAGAIDGFIALPGGSWESLRLFTDEVMPALADEGLIRADGPATLGARLGIEEPQLA